MSSSGLTDLADQLEEALTEVLDEEEARLMTERDFLPGVVEGTTDGITLEDSSTELTTLLLSGYLSSHLPIDEALTETE